VRMRVRSLAKPEPYVISGSASGGRIEAGGRSLAASLPAAISGIAARANSNSSTRPQTLATFKANPEPPRYPADRSSADPVMSCGRTLREFFDTSVSLRAWVLGRLRVITSNSARRPVHTLVCMGDSRESVTSSAINVHESACVASADARTPDVLALLIGSGRLGTTQSRRGQQVIRGDGRLARCRPAMHSRRVTILTSSMPHCPHRALGPVQMIRAVRMSRGAGLDEPSCRMTERCETAWPRPAHAVIRNSSAEVVEDERRLWLDDSRVRVDAALVV